MKEIDFYVKDSLGLHMRPAAAFAGIAKRAKSSIFIEKKGREPVDARMILMVIRMGIKQAEDFMIRVEGEDEDEISQEITALLGEL